MNSNAQFDHRKIRSLLLTGESPDQKRLELKTYYNNTTTIYEQLFDLLQEESAYYSKPEPLRHPLIFYFGHTATFFVNKLMLAKLIDQCINPSFESMFAIGVDEMSWDDLNEKNYDWPEVAAVKSYRDQVRDVVNHLIDTMPLSLPIEKGSAAWVILMGIEHERIHLETSSVIMRMLPIDQINKSLPHWSSCTDFGIAPDNQLLPVTADTITLGKTSSDKTYGWDNEYGAKTVEVTPFKVSQYLVSNDEYLKFIKAGGYVSPEYWTDEGKKWLDYTKATMPRFWIKRKKEYWQRNLTNEIPLPLNWPVEVNYLEAKAFCNWKSQQENTIIRLPTEAEWYRLRNQLDEDHPSWEEAPGNINLEYHASSCPVDRFSVEIEGHALFDLVGNVWQWTETPIDAFPGFQVDPLYDDFSTPTFDGKHNLIKGGSWISTGNESLKSSRYAFRRHFFQHAGFRYIEPSSEQLPVEPVNSYETNNLVSQYLEFHYGPTYFNVGNFPQACIDTAMQHVSGSPHQRALDLGCAVGRSTFELARHYDHVDGIDFSARFIQCAFQLVENNGIRYTIPTEGELVEYREQTLEALGLSQLAEKVHFSQGDATNLKPQFTRYDLVFAGNLLDRLSQPKRFLERIVDRINPQGWLVLTSPYTWLEEYTAKEHWLGGHKVNGENVTTKDGLHITLGKHFELIETHDIPFVIRETARKHQHTLAEMTIWRKR